jgi:hypothetical protein
MDRAAERPVSAGPMVGINSRCSTRIRSEIMSVGAAQTLLLVVTHLRGVRPLSSPWHPDGDGRQAQNCRPARPVR